MKSQWIKIAALVGTLATGIALFVPAEPLWLYAPVVGGGIGIITHQIGKGVRARRLGMRGEPSIADTRAAYQSLRDIAEKMGEKASVETATLLLDSEKESFERTYTGSDNLERKATTLLGVVTGASSAFGLFGVAKPGSPITLTPIIFTAFTFVLASFAALLYMLRAKTFITPDLRVYHTPVIARDDNRAALSLSLAARYNEMREDLRRETSAEPHALFIAYGSLAIAAMLVVLNTISPGAAPSTKPRAAVALPPSGSFPDSRGTTGRR